MNETLPRPIGDRALRQWKYDLALALGYRTVSPTGHPRKHMYNLIEDPFAFIEDTNEVIAWEIDGETGDHGFQVSHVLPGTGDLALKPVRYPMPAGFEIVDVTTTDGAVHRVALRKASA